MGKAGHSKAGHSESGGGGALVGVMTVVLTLFGWTVTPLFIEHFAGSIDAWTSNGWRYPMAALMWSPLLVVGAMRRKLPPGLWRAALVPSLINASAQVAFTLSFYFIDPGLVAFGLRAQMVFVTIGAAIMFPSERRVIRSGVFLLGLVFVVGGTAGTIGLDEGIKNWETAFGVAMAVLAGSGFAGYALSVRKCMQHIPSMTAFAAISAYTAVVQLGLMLVFADRMGAGALDLSGEQFGLLVLSAAIGIAAGHVLYYISIKRLGVAVSAGVIQLQPFTVGLLSFWWFGEVLTGTQWMTGTIAVTGALLMLAVQHKMREREVAQAGEAEPAEYAELPPDAVSAAAADEACARRSP